MKLTPEQKLKLVEIALQKKRIDDDQRTLRTIKGDKGDIPNHRWNGTALQFENPDGSWGTFVDLKGDKGDSIQGEKGEKGEDGKDAEFTEQDKQEIIESLKDIFSLDIQTLESTINEIKEQHESILDYVSMYEAETPESIVEKLETLEGEDRLNYTAIDGLEDIIRKLAPGQSVISNSNKYLGQMLDVDLSGVTYTGGKYILGSGGGSGWSLTGNAGTTAGTNFLGTTDDVDLVFKRNSVEFARLQQSGTTQIWEFGGAINELRNFQDNPFIKNEDDKLTLYGGTTPGIYLDNGLVYLQTTSWVRDGNELRFSETGNGNYVAFKAGTLSANITWTLPTTDSTGIQALVSDGSGVLSWASFGDVTAASTFGTDNRLIRSDGTGKGVQSSGVTLSDTDSFSGVVNITSTGQFLGGDGTVSLPTYSFSGDPDTGFYRSGSTLRYAKDGIERIRITSNGHISVNANATGIATSNGVFHGTYDADTNSQDGIITIDTYSTTGYTTTIGGRRARGTAASPTQIMAGDKIVEFIGKGWHGGGDFAASNRALMGFYANEDWNSSTANGTYITLNTTTDATGANHQSLLIDDEGNVSLDTATTNVTTTIFPSTWASTSAKHFVIRSGGTNRDTGLFIRNGDDTAGLNIWNDTSAREVSYDSMVDHASSKHIFRLRTLGTALTPLTLDVNGALLGVGSNLRLQGATSGTATIVAPTAAGTPTLTLPTVSGTFLTSADKISAHAATTSAELAGVISDETGSGSLVFATSPTLVTPILGTFAATAGTITNTITNYNGIATAGNGLASVVATGGETGRTSALAATTIFAVPASKGGMYMVCVNANITRGATTSSILGNVDVTFTSPTDSVAKTIMDGNSNFVNRTAGNTTGDGISYTFSVYAKASTNIQLAIGYTSSGATTMEYEYRYSVVYLG